MLFLFSDNFPFGEVKTLSMSETFAGDCIFVRMNKIVFICWKKILMVALALLQHCLHNNSACSGKFCRSLTDKNCLWGLSIVSWTCPVQQPALLRSCPKAVIVFHQVFPQSITQFGLTLSAWSLSPLTHPYSRLILKNNSSMRTYANNTNSQCSVECEVSCQEHVQTAVLPQTTGSYSTTDLITIHAGDRILLVKSINLNIFTMFANGL